MRKKPIRGSLRFNRSHPLAQGLVAAYLFNESGGLTIHEPVGGHDGTMVNMTASTAWILGPDGPRLEFAAASNHRVNIPYSERLNLFTGLTIAVRFTPQIGSLFPVIGKPFAVTHTNPFFDWALIIRADGPINIRIGTASIFTTTNLLDDTLYDVAVTADGVNYRFYIDGDLIQTSSSSALPTNTNSQDIRIGTNADDGEDMPAALDYIYVWNRALPPKSLRDIKENPYDMFRPKRRIAMPVAAPAGGFIPYPYPTTYDGGVAVLTGGMQ